MLVFFMAFPFGWRSQRGGLLADALEVLQIFVDEGAPLLYAVHTAQRVGGGVEGEVQQFVDGGRSYMETGIAGCIINIHAAVLIGTAPLVNTTLETSPTRSQSRGAIRKPEGSAITLLGSSSAVTNT